jgi:hypothetical protein
MPPSADAGVWLLMQVGTVLGLVTGFPVGTCWPVAATQ